MFFARFCGLFADSELSLGWMGSEYLVSAVLVHVFGQHRSSQRSTSAAPSATMLLNCALALLLLCNVLDCSAQCKDSNNGTLDRDCDGCEYYDFHNADCGLYDDNDFSAEVMCCACGGGSSQWTSFRGDHHLQAATLLPA